MHNCMHIGYINRKEFKLNWKKKLIDTSFNDFECVMKYHTQTYHFCDFVFLFSDYIMNLFINRCRKLLNYKVDWQLVRILVKYFDLVNIKNEQVEEVVLVKSTIYMMRTHHRDSTSNGFNFVLIKSMSTSCTQGAANFRRKKKIDRFSNTRRYKYEKNSRPPPKTCKT